VLFRDLKSAGESGLVPFEAGGMGEGGVFDVEDAEEGVGFSRRKDVGEDGKAGPGHFA